jgi:DNA-binding transcriptional MerR regulator
MTFTKREVANLVGLSARNIQYWVDMELIIPDVSPKSGRGKALLFSRENLVHIEMVKILQQCGLSLQMIVSLMSSVQNDGRDDPARKDFNFDICDKNIWEFSDAALAHNELVVDVGELSLGTGCVIMDRVIKKAQGFVDGYLGRP